MKCAIIIDIIIHCVYYSLWEKEPPNGARLTYLSVLPFMDDAGTLGTLIQNKYKMFQRIVTIKKDMPKFRVLYPDPQSNSS